MQTHSLIRTDARPDGIFSEFWFEGDKDKFMVTLEHAYFDQQTQRYEAKIQPGTYLCQRGWHTIGEGEHAKRIDTFEVTGVVGHSGILCCHVGNYNRNSNGCVLAGEKIIDGPDGEQMITNSEHMYESYMARMGSTQQFYLHVL